LEFCFKNPFTFLYLSYYYFVAFCTSRASVSGQMPPTCLFIVSTLSYDGQLPLLHLPSSC